MFAEQAPVLNINDSKFNWLRYLLQAEKLSQVMKWDGLNVKTSQAQTLVDIKQIKWKMKHSRI